jgi:hypothetical protein
MTHFEIFGEAPAKLAEFYREVLGWQIEKAAGVDYWRIQTAPVGEVGGAPLSANFDDYEFWAGGRRPRETGFWNRPVRHVHRRLSKGE